MKNNLAYLGFLGLFGFLGFFSFLGENVNQAFPLLGFLFFFYYAKVTPDEFFWLHVKNAATRAFFTWMTLGVVVYCGALLIDNVAYLRLLTMLPMVTALLVFIISLEIAEQREKKVLQYEYED